MVAQRMRFDDHWHVPRALQSGFDHFPRRGVGEFQNLVILNLQKDRDERFGQRLSSLWNSILADPRVNEPNLQVPVKRERRRGINGLRSKPRRRK